MNLASSSFHGVPWGCWQVFVFEESCIDDSFGLPFLFVHEHIAGGVYIIGPQHFDLPSWEACFVHNRMAAKPGYILEKECKQAQFKKRKRTMILHMGCVRTCKLIYYV